MEHKRDANSWVKFRLLMWKNFLQQWRHPVQTAAELLIPVITLSLILIIRWQIVPYDIKLQAFEPVRAQSLSNSSLMILSEMNLTDISIAYSPQSNILEDIVRRAIGNLLIDNAQYLMPIILESLNLTNITIPSKLGLNLNEISETISSPLINVQAFNNSADLVGIYSDELYTRKTLAAVEFSDSLLGATDIPDKINYSLRFPERPRLNSFFLTGSRSWRTDLVFPAFEQPGPRFPSSPAGGDDPGYVYEMFIILQHYITTELIHTITGQNLRSFNINLQRFPHPAYSEDLAVDLMQELLPLFVVISFTYIAINITRAVTLEKELQLKETLKIMGLPTWIHWMAWFFKQFLFLLLGSILIVLILKISWFSSEDGTGNTALLTYTPWHVLFFFLNLYFCCMIFFCFMISGFFSKGSTASLFMGIIWFITYIPAMLLSMDINLSTVGQAFTFLSVNTAMSYGFQQLLAKENSGGMQWGEFMSMTDLDSTRLTFGHVVIFLAVDCVLYMLIALYLEQVLPGPYGIPKPWYFLFQKSFWCSGRKQNEILETANSSNREITMEQEPTDHTIGVKIINLTKVFGSNTAVNNLSLNIYDDQITLLLGHNGAGKSTVISMLTGNLPVTSGSVWVAGYDMSSQLTSARSHLGLCPQHNVIFDDLTVREHLEFFARLKGFQGVELDKEIKTLINDLELQDKRNDLARGLSGGQKRRLCVGIALSGQARVVLLDEPTSGMDPSSRRALWDLLQKVKKGRTIILTTHFMDEADYLGDRVAIMAHGQLQCVGSPYFLKQHYGVGYTLVVVKDEDFRNDECTALLNKYISNTEVKDDRGTEVTYSLSNDYSYIFGDMLSELESKIDSIKFKNYGLIATTLEDVFLSVGSSSESIKYLSEDTDCNTINNNNINQHDMPTSSIEQLDKEEIVTGAQAIWLHVKAIWIKLWLTKIRSFSILLLQFIFPLFDIVLTLIIMEYSVSLTNAIHSRLLSFTEGYASTESLLAFNGTNSTSVGALAKVAYEDVYSLLDNNNINLTVVDGQPIDTYYLKRAEEGNMGHLRYSLLGGATFNDESATAWFSNFAYHDLPTSLAALHNAVLKAFQPNAEINVANHPLEANYEDQRDMNIMLLILSFQISFSIGNGMGMVTAVFIMFYIKERVSRAKLLQKAAGIKPIVMWGSAAIFDWFWLLVISITIVIPCVAFSVIGLSSAAEIGRLYLCIMVYGAAALPLHYLVSMLFNGPAIGFVVMYFINLLFGLMGSQIVEVLANPLLDTENVANIMDAILQCFPLYSFVTAVRSMISVTMAEHSCLDRCERLSHLAHIEECNMQVLCQNYPDVCCVSDSAHFNWEKPGILRYLVVSLISCVVLWIILMVIEYRLLHKVFTFTKKALPVDENTLDEDVANEIQHVKRVRNSGLGDDSLVASELTKFYGKRLAVNQVSFTVSESECFGLLGVNGAGKTTTFKMLMGDETMSYGDAFVGTHSVKTDITNVHKNIGYCPQFDAVFGELTGRETLYIFSLLRGLKPEDSSKRTNILSTALGFTEHLDKRVHQYSGGNKRKLSTAVALMGRTRLVFVDEPTTGVDPAAKRQVWRALRGAMNGGRGVVLTSHSMEECEALCSRLTIMVAGGFRCIGTPQHLKNKFSQGFTLTIKLRFVESNANVSSNATAADGVKDYVRTNFTNPTLMEEYRGLLTYYLPDRNVAWSSMFGIMENAKRELDIEDYKISQTTLEQIFLQFTKYQQNQILQSTEL
ncbi:phospholipid-transporting ATPase ABCA1-like [Achroia grisella]|uniref:phospholipid-transporting ATPase ABCA1-like n=1 Tax=Achroia grisella TaxID=688607 RepID=UPI0027D1EB41|nr:phospholipid-transporting ATPase ABCA1-like [Achroia grisella]